MCRRAFNKTIILLGLAGWEMMNDDNQLYATRLIGYLSFHIQRALIE